MSNTNTQKLLTAVAKCNYNRSTHEYAVHWEKNENNFNTATVEEIVQQIEKEYPKTNSSLFRKKIGGRHYLVVGTIWHTEYKPDEYLLKFYGDGNIESGGNKKTGHPFRNFFCILLLVVAVGIVGYRYGESQNVVTAEPPDNPVATQLSELTDKIGELATNISEVKSGTDGLSKGIEELKTTLQEEVKPKMDTILKNITKLTAYVNEIKDAIIKEIETKQSKVLEKIDKIDENIESLKKQVGNIDKILLGHKRMDTSPTVHHDSNNPPLDPTLNKHQAQPNSPPQHNNQENNHQPPQTKHNQKSN